MNAIFNLRNKTLTKIIVFFVFAIVLTSSCKKDDDIMLDKKITLDLYNSHYPYEINNDTLLLNSIINFCKNDYSKIDSIFFIINGLQTKSTYDGMDIHDSISIELYNLTDNVSINNSRIISDDITYNTYKSTNNLINYLPDYPINLGLRIVYDKEHCYWVLDIASLVLVRK